MNRVSTIAFAFLIFSFKAFCQQIHYDISFENAVHHEASVTIRYSGLSGEPLQLRMSRTSPGRYALHEFAKNIYNVKVIDGKGNPLKIERTNPHQWDVPSHDGNVTVSYTLYADRADGTYSAIDETHAHLNMPATFMYAVGLERIPILINFRVREDLRWKVATQLKQIEYNAYSAPGLDYFLDSPTELGDFELREWVVKSGENEYKIKLVVHHDGSQEDIDQYASMVKKVVEEEMAVFGELPDFDYGTYTFLACYLPHVEGDGMEHRNSTVLTSRHPLKTGAKINIGTVSHEFFHAWNVERLRPASLEPFDFSAENMSSELWFAEGFTSYYTTLILCRAGIMSQEEYVKSLAGTINYVVNSPARKSFSPAGMSEQASFYDGAVFLDPMNTENTFISYYSYGALLGLALDLMIREKFPNKNLDTYMRALWQKFGKPEIPYTTADLRETLASHTGDKAFAQQFFNQFVHSSNIPDLKNLLSKVGVSLHLERPGNVRLRPAAINFERGVPMVNIEALEGGGLYEAGISKGDIILSIDKKKILTAEDLTAILQRVKPGDSVEILYLQRGREKTTRLTFKEDNRMAVDLYENRGLKVDKDIMKFRNDWWQPKY